MKQSTFGLRSSVFGLRSSVFGLLIFLFSASQVECANQDKPSAKKQTSWQINPRVLTGLKCAGCAAVAAVIAFLGWTIKKQKREIEKQNNEIKNLNYLKQIAIFGRAEHKDGEQYQLSWGCSDDNCLQIGYYYTEHKDGLNLFCPLEVDSQISLYAYNHKLKITGKIPLRINRYSCMNYTFEELSPTAPR